MFNWTSFDPTSDAGWLVKGRWLDRMTVFTPDQVSTYDPDSQAAVISSSNALLAGISTLFSEEAYGSNLAPGAEAVLLWDHGKLAIATKGRRRQCRQPLRPQEPQRDEDGERHCDQLGRRDQLRRGLLCLRSELRAGKLKITGSGLSAAKKTVKKSGRVTITLKPKRALKKKLAKKGSAKVKIKFAFTPAGATSAVSSSKTYKLKR